MSAEYERRSHWRPKAENNSRGAPFDCEHAYTLQRSLRLCKVSPRKVPQKSREQSQNTLPTLFNDFLENLQIVHVPCFSSFLVARETCLRGRCVQDRLTRFEESIRFSYCLVVEWFEPFWFLIWTAQKHWQSAREAVF